MNEQENCSGLVPGDKDKILIFNPGYLNNGLSYEEIRKNDDEASSAVIQNRLLLWPFIKRCDTQPPLIPIGPDAAQRLCDLFDLAMQELIEQDSFWFPCKERGYITDSMFHLGTYITTTQRDGGLSYSCLSKEKATLLAYLCENFNRKLILEDVASRFATNRTTLNVRIKALTGYTFNAYLIDLRLRKANLLLTDTSLPISEVAEKAGIEDITNLERLCKRRIECTPGEFRKRYR